MKNYNTESIGECIENFNETFETTDIYIPTFTDWVSTNKNDKGEETIVYSVIEPGTGRQISTDLELDESRIIENSRELYDAVKEVFKQGSDVGDALKNLQMVYETI